MKTKLLSIAVLGALGAMSQPAMAANNLAYNNHDVSVYFSSATAVRDTFLRGIKIFCDTGNAVTKPFKLYNLGTNSNFRAYECTLKDDSATNGPVSAQGLQGKTLLVRHSVDVNPQLGGSIVGVQPIYKNMPMKFVNPASGTCTANGTDATSGFPRFDCTDSEGKVPDIGASDTEPSSFTGPNLPNDLVIAPAEPPLAVDQMIDAWQSELVGFGDYYGNTLDIANYDTAPAFQVGFGMALTKNVLAQVPNLRLAHVQSILSGGADSWKQLRAGVLDANGVPAPGPDEPIKVCRRTKGSGTQASYNAFITYNPCLSAPGIEGALSVQGATTEGGPNGILVVIENSATSGVRDCLAAANTAGEFALGLISMENKGVFAGWEFAPLDGVDMWESAETSFDHDGNGATPNAPADGVSDRIREQFMVAGWWPFYQEVTVQWRLAETTFQYCNNGLDGTPGTGDDTNCQTNTMPALAGDKLAFGQLIREGIGLPEITLQLPGVISLPKHWEASTVARPALYAGISEYSRNGNSCRPSTYQANPAALPVTP